MFVVRILVGLLKGALVGGLVGGVLWFLETGGDLAAEARLAWLRWPTYGVIGLLAGVVAGRPPWAKGAAWVTSIIKGVFGFGLCVGLYFLADLALGSFENLLGFGRTPTTWYFGFGAALGAVYAIWIELDDGGKRDEEKEKKAAAKPTPKKEA